MRKKEEVYKKCKEAIKKIDDILAQPEKKYTKIEIMNMKYDLGKIALQNIRKEIIKMSEILNSKEYKLSYGRFLLDFPQTELVDYLLELAYFYNKNL